MSASYPTKLQIWGACAARCCMCKTVLLKDIPGVLDKSALGEVAHIEGEHSGAKRFNANQTEEERNSFPNLMLMCPNHHTEVDRDEHTYTVSVLQKMKADHEAWVNAQLAMASFDISFAELEVVLKYLSQNQAPQSPASYILLPPTEKISKNQLSHSVASFITMGMIRTELVKDYLNRNPDVNFAARLRDGFVAKYNQLKASKSGDELFFQLLDFASGSSSIFTNQAAALTVVVYFFQICDIFES